MTRGAALWLLLVVYFSAGAQGLFGEVDEQEEIRIGAELSAKLLGAVPLVPNEELQRYVNKLGLWLALQSERPQLPWRFGVLDTEIVNAFAAPGGYIFLTRGLFEALENEQQLAGVLAHEIVHVLEQHHLQAIKKQMVTGLVAGVAAHLLIDDPNVASAVAGIGTELWSKGLDRKDEVEADRVGVVIAARAGFAPDGLASMLRRLDSMNPEDPSLAFMFSTHPSNSDRLEALQEAMAGHFDGIDGGSDDAEFAARQEQVRSGPPAAVAAVPAPEGTKALVAGGAVPAAGAAAPGGGIGPSTLGGEGDLGKLVAAPEAGLRFQDQLKDGSPGPEMVVIAAGTFRMGDVAGTGSEKPVHKVSILRAFSLGRYEVSFAEYDRFAKATGRGKPDDDGIGRGALPVLNVSWHDASAYIAWLSSQTGHNYRLPSEAEWEFAVRAGSTAARPWRAAAAACRFANVGDQALKRQMAARGVPVSNEHPCDDGHAGPAPIGSFEANAFGLHDMLGNLFEWTGDCGQTTYAGAPTNGAAWIVPTCPTRVSRGGSWESGPEQVRSAARTMLAPDYRDARLGFRVARDL